MADSDSLRSRRKRLHSRNDHSLCRHDGRSTLPAPFPGDDAPLDARASLTRLCRRLEAAHVASPADAGVARVLLEALRALPSGPGPEPEDDPLAELRALDPSLS